MRKFLHINLWLGLLVITVCLFVANRVFAAAPPAQNPQSGAVGLHGKINSTPPTVGATITLPRSGQGFSETPITVTGICPKGLLVKVFRNNIFAGSADCSNGSFTLQIDLFGGQNDIVARVYDALDQQGPDSNTVSVTFNDSRRGSSGTSLLLSSNYAKRGAAPGDTLEWPIILAGGIGPYAVSVDWGDGTSPDLISQSFPGNFTVKHIYKAAGVYTVVVKVSDSTGASAFLQLVGVGNGEVSQTSTSSQQNSNTVLKVLWQPAAALLPVMIIVFWLGSRFQLFRIKKRVENGEQPFK